MTNFHLQIVTLVLLAMASCTGSDQGVNGAETGPEDTLPQKTELPSPSAIKANLESINARDSIFSSFKTIAGISYGDPIEKAREIYGEPDKIYDPKPEIFYDYYFNTDQQRMLSFQYNPQRGNVIESVFYGPSVDVFDSIPHHAQMTEFKEFMQEKYPADPKLDYLSRPMDEIKVLFANVQSGGFGSDLWSQIYESSYLDVKFIRMSASETCGEINVFWRY